MKYDLIVIGGGPSGMMAAGRAAENGASVLLLEKREKLGIKLSITGKGRCNITNAEFDRRKLVGAYGKKGRFLFSALAAFGPREAIDFFEARGIKTKTERGNRVFPASDESADVISALLRYLHEHRVEIRTNAAVKSIGFKGNGIEKVTLTGGEEYRAGHYALCSGGLAYPQTGSTGDAYAWLREMGHTVVAPQPALVPVITQERFVKELEGLSLKNVSVGVFQNGKKAASEFGEALFTSHGLSGPIVIDMSKAIGECLKKGGTELRIDFKPALGFPELDKRIRKDFTEFHNKQYKNSLHRLLPKKLIPVIIRLSGIDPEKKVNEITKEQRMALIHLLKEFSLAVKSLEGFDRAIVTAGGVDLQEIDPKTMRSKIIENLFIAGELLDIDGPTGGYNLQMAWSTGYCIGQHCGK
ncbi:MAG: NAD(P)/FAD-dependent oxidoreductase [Patescibacteria group bacterium]